MTRDSAGLAGSIMGRLQALPRRLKAAGGVLALVTLALAVMAPWIALAGMAGIAIGVAAARLAEAAGTEALPPDAVALRTQQPLDEGVSPVLAWRGLVDALPDPVIAIDDNQFVVHANPPAYDLFAAMRRGGPVALASRSPELAEALAHALRYRERRTVRLHERVPVERQLDATLSPVRTRSPGFPALLIELHDISERDRLAQMRADFVAHASHELRTPLAALRGFVETLQGAAKDDPVARERFLGIMWAESLRMTRILDDLLSLARVEMRAHLVPSDRVPVNATLAGVVRSMEPLAATVGAKVEVSAPPTELYARGDRDEIVQVLVNLLQNALKYGRKG
ncbi:MAG: histidine kinase dimerization/phospho-acceptor domain-containing protein, partial [Hyphomicrobiaceae bacterium]